MARASGCRWIPAARSRSGDESTCASTATRRPPSRRDDALSARVGAVLASKPRASFAPPSSTPRPGGATMTTAAAAFSHFGIHVTDLPRMEDFYTRVLGLLVSDRGTLQNGLTLVFLSRDPDEHHQMVLVTGRPPGVEYNVVNQMSFKLPTLQDLKGRYAALRDAGVKEFRIVTHGNAWSIYFPDPEGNRLE